MKSNLFGVVLAILLFIPSIGFTGEIGVAPAHVERGIKTWIIPARGVAWLEGLHHNRIIVGHSPGSFSDLYALEVGDRFLVGRTEYRVVSRDVVHKSRVDVLNQTGPARVTLMTCVGSEYRLIVVGIDA